MEDDINRKIERCLITQGFADECNKRNLERKYSNIALFNFTISFIKEKCNIDIAFKGVNDIAWYRFYTKILNKALKGAITIKKEVYNEASIITPASAIYMSLYELYGHDASNKMYKLLEDFIVEHLNGKENNIDLLFYPIEENIMEKQIEITKLILKREPNICKISFFIPLFCSKSKRLYKKMSESCVKKVTLLCDEVIIYA